MKNVDPIYPLDIANMIELAKSDPVAFEKERQAALDHFFTTIDDDNRDNLQSMQVEIDYQRSNSKSPMEMCEKLNDMMWKQVIDDRGFAMSIYAPKTYYRRHCEEQENTTNVVKGLISAQKEEPLLKSA